MSEAAYNIGLIDEPWATTCARIRRGQHVHMVNANDPDDVMCSADPHCEGTDHVYLEPASLSRLDTSTAADTCADGQGQTVQTKRTQR